MPLQKHKSRVQHNIQLECCGIRPTELQSAFLTVAQKLNYGFLKSYHKYHQLIEHATHNSDKNVQVPSHHWTVSLGHFVEVILRPW